jgi:SAM-dependent methyltransferase
MDITAIAQDFKKNGSLWMKIFVVVLLILCFFLCFSPNEVEGFATSPTFNVRRGEDVYDSLYVSLYDDLVYCKEKENFEIDAFLKATRPEAKTSKILDVGSGTGRHVGTLAQKGFSVIGIDSSEAMVSEARANYPECEFKQDDAMSPMAFPNGSFTHITCFYFTVYYFKNRRDFFKNCYDWLMPGGHLLIHLVNREEFIPVITAANPFTAFAAQHFSGNRMTQTKVKLNDYQYRSNYDYDANEAKATLTEDLVNTSTGAIRKNEHTLYMARQREIIDEATSVGFKKSGKFDMSECHYDTHYLYALRK